MINMCLNIQSREDQLQLHKLDNENHSKSRGLIS